MPTATELATFARLFNAPSWQEMHDDLSPSGFEHFVAYVFRCAGYDAQVVGPHWRKGVDVEVRLPGQARIFAGIECKRFASSQLVNAHIAQHVKGASTLSRGGKPFVITTSGCTEEAYQMADAGRRHAYLVNGDQFVRYINYVRGSRRDDEYTITALSPEFFAGREYTPPQPDGACTILTVANNKGGVGKTTTAYYLGAELARQGQRVLLIDLDGQANLTERCFPDLTWDDNDTIGHFPNIAQYFAHEHKLGDLIISADQDRLSIIPSDPNLTFHELGGSGRPDVETSFAKDVRLLADLPIASLGGTPQWIIIDTPPAMSVFTRAGLAAAQYVLAPMRPRRLSLQGTRNMLKTLRTTNALMTSNATFMGTVITHWDDLKQSQNFEDLLLPPALREFGSTSFTVKIPMDNQLEILEPGAKTHGAEAYEKLATEILDYVQPGPPAQHPVGVVSHDHARRGEQNGNEIG